MVLPRPKELLSELRRRRVGRVAVAYAVTAWLPWVRALSWQYAHWLIPLQDDPRYRSLLERMHLPPPPSKRIASQSKSAS